MSGNPALGTYKKLFLFAEAFKNTHKFKYKSKGSAYILHLLAFVEIRLFNEFLWEKKKAGFGKLIKNMRDAGFSQKRGGNAGSRPSLPDPISLLLPFTAGLGDW